MNRYPTEEELNQLIEELERQQLYAPRHLKEEILLKVKEQNASHSGQSTQVSFFLYTLKMVAGMAAAVFMVFAIPAGDGSDLSHAAFLEEEITQAEEKISYHFENGKDKISKTTDYINQKLDAIFQRVNLGGYDDEN